MDFDNSRNRFRPNSDSYGFHEYHLSPSSKNNDEEDLAAGLMEFIEDDNVDTMNLIREECRRCWRLEK